MKQFIFLLVAFVGFTMTTQAQLRTTTRSNVMQGTYLDFPGAFTPTSSASVPSSAQSDTLQVSDTVAYIIPITHTNDVDFFLQWYWNKSGAGTAGITVTFYQSNDPYNFPAASQLTAGVAQANYSKVYALSASGWQQVSFKKDSVNFVGRYLKIQYLTSATASVGGKVFSRLKSTIK